MKKLALGTLLPCWYAPNHIRSSMSRPLQGTCSSKYEQNIIVFDGILLYSISISEQHDNPIRALPLHLYYLEYMKQLDKSRGSETPAAPPAEPPAEGGYVKQNTKKRRPEMPAFPIGEECRNHWPVWQPNRCRCRMMGCTQKSYIMCQSCRYYLCFNKDRNCFTRFHSGT